MILICCNITKVPAAFATIVTAAFSPKAITGGAVGSMLIAMQKGVARGIFSNEAGLGSAPIAAAAAQTNSPVRQGLVSMTGTFIDTIIICTLTGLSIVLTLSLIHISLYFLTITSFIISRARADALYRLLRRLLVL